MVMYILYLLTWYIAEQEKNSTRQNVEYDRSPPSQHMDGEIHENILTFVTYSSYQFSSEESFF